MSAKSPSMACLHPGISAAQDPALGLLGWSEVEEDDGDSYAELWRQILQLTSDGSMNQGLSCQVAAPSPMSCSDWQMNSWDAKPSPAWALRSGSGTGVFIPTATAGKVEGRQVRPARKKKAKKPAQKK